MHLIVSIFANSVQ